MTDIAIRVHNLSKCYQIYATPRDRLKQFVLPPLRQMLGKSATQYYNEFWALKDVSFEVKKGETVGIIGRNGSGKSTLLQMICGTLNPTSGGIQTNGRIAALLELGSGFNPEFTGRENVFLNGALLGLSTEEIEARFDEIASFADIGEFIEQPVKTYSSGMYVRLAFAVIVHVDADILIVDEALAVGDSFFTQKCMLQIKKLMDSGVTLLFVSHDSNAVKALCSNALLLDHGEVSCQGDTNKVVETYYGNFIQKQQKTFSPPDVDFESNAHEELDSTSLINNETFQSRAKFKRLQNGKADFINVQLLNKNNEDIQDVIFGQPVVLRMIVRANFALPSLNLAYHIRDKNGFDLVYSDTAIERCPITGMQLGEQYVVDWSFEVALREGDYTIATMLSIPLNLDIGQVEVCDFVPIAVQLKVRWGVALPIYGAVYWTNKVTSRLIGAKPVAATQVHGEKK